MPIFPNMRTCKLLATFSLFLLFALCSSRLFAQQSWTAVGPAGGDARALAAVPGDPSHLYLGTTNSWLYESTDAAATWHRLAKMPGSNAMVLDHIVVDPANPATIYVAAWRADNPGGGVWVSHDAGHTWTESPDMHGKSVFSFTQAESDPKIFFAGTLEGVFRSTDSGTTWSLISPPGSHEIHEVESLAIDPKDPDIVYAGTWHLPWKTTNGGKTWNNIQKGLIVDSDVFSIILDPERTSTVYLSACSGIYKSDNAGALFRKIQGIPTEARRTRVLRQDPQNRLVVYAGTTEGLYKTENAGRTFRLLTASDVIVNDVFVDPANSNHVILATDRGGVLVSQDAGETFIPSNLGVSERKIEALLVDNLHPQRLYAGVVNDKLYGGVFISDDSGKSWAQTGSGLDGRDVYSLAQTSDGEVVAGTNDGIFLLDPPAATGSGSPVPPSSLTWEPRNFIANTIVRTVSETHMNTRVNVEKQVKVPVIELAGRINALDVSTDVWVAAASYGLLTSRDKGATWQGGPVMGAGEYLSVTVHGDAIAAARADGAVLSQDKGQTWWPMMLPTMLTRIHRITFSPDGTLWLGAREGVYFTRDLGKTWLWIQRLPFRDVDDLSYDAALGRILVSSRNSDQVFSIDPKTMTWNWWQTGFQIALIRSAGNQILAASIGDGVVIAPQLAAPLTAQSASTPASAKE